MDLQYIYLRDKQTTLNTNRHPVQHTTLRGVTTVWWTQMTPLGM